MIQTFTGRQLKYAAIYVLKIFDEDPNIQKKNKNIPHLTELANDRISFKKPTKFTDFYQ